MRRDIKRQSGKTKISSVKRQQQKQKRNFCGKTGLNAMRVLSLQASSWLDAAVSSQDEPSHYIIAAMNKFCK